jgi:hypothetical protein
LLLLYELPQAGQLCIICSGLFGRNIALDPPSPRCASAIQIGFVAAAYVFHRYDIRLPILFVILGASVFFINDIGRVARFFGHVGFSMEFGYLVGGIVGAWLGWMIGVSLLSVTQMV